MPKRKKKVLLSASFAILAATVVSGCQDKLVFISQKDLCEKGWKHLDVSKNDKLTQKTAAKMEGNNNARPLWGCEPGKDQAQGKS